MVSVFRQTVAGGRRRHRMGGRSGVRWRNGQRTDTRIIGPVDTTQLRWGTAVFVYGRLAAR